MVASMITECQCPHCQQDGAPPERALHRRMNVFMSRLDEAQRRWSHSGWARAVIACWPRSPGWTRRRSAEAGRNWARS